MAPFGSPELSNEELARRYAEGQDQEAFSELCRRMAPLTRRLFMALFGGAIDDVEDAEQETLVALVTALRRFDGRSSARTYWYRVARNTGIDILRDRGRQRRVRQEIVSSASLRALDSVDGPEERILEQEAAESYFRLLRQLPEEDRLLLHLFYVEEQSIAEVSQAVGARPGTVKSRLHRIRRRLQRMRKQEYGQKE
jgi:RNA polymerase sigma-70 factor (ECF subfamily)